MALRMDLDGRKRDDLDRGEFSAREVASKFQHASESLTREALETGLEFLTFQATELQAAAHVLWADGYVLHNRAVATWLDGLWDRYVYPRILD